MTTATNNQNGNQAVSGNERKEGRNMAGSIVKHLSKVMVGMVASAVFAGAALAVMPGTTRAQGSACDFDWTKDGIITMSDVVFVVSKYGLEVDGKYIMSKEISQTLLHYGETCS